MTLSQSGLSDVESYWEKWKEEEAKKQRLAFEQREIVRLGGKYNYLKFTKDSYDNRKVLAAMDDFPKASYLLFGSVGTGKTHAAVAVGRLEPSTVFYTLGDLALKIRACSNASEEIAIYNFCATRPLILDDIGSEKGTEFVINILYRLLDDRIKNMQGGLIMTSNKDIKNLQEAYGTRITSRLLGLVGNNVLEISGKDRRIGGVL